MRFKALLAFGIVLLALLLFRVLSPEPGPNLPLDVPRQCGAAVAQRVLRLASDLPGTGPIVWIDRPAASDASRRAIDAEWEGFAKACREANLSVERARRSQSSPDQGVDARAAAMEAPASYADLADARPEARLLIVSCAPSQIPTEAQWGNRPPFAVFDLATTTARARNALERPHLRLVTCRHEGSPTEPSTGLPEFDRKYQILTD